MSSVSADSKVKGQLAAGENGGEKVDHGSGGMSPLRAA